tara:strand:- start:2242 stop:3129 length:888 start_codon:yes stop_codon:yes gene_type:complete
MLIVDLKTLCNSTTPIDYKMNLTQKKSNAEKGNFDNDILKQSAFKFVLLDKLSNKESNCLKENCIPISNLPDENINSQKNKSYIKQVKSKAYKSGKYAITKKELIDINIKVANLEKRNPFLLPTIFQKGEYLKKDKMLYNIETGNFVKKALKSNNNICQIDFKVDFFKKVKTTGYCILVIQEREIDPERIIYKFHEKGLDIYSSFCIDAFKKKYQLSGMQFYILAVENNYKGNSVMFKLSELSNEIGIESFKKRIKTIHNCYETNSFYGFQETSNPIKISLNQTLIKRREANESW